jgi:hypothetical protein
MKGDFSRSTFRPEKHYSRVLIEQGRVQVDADWNEQQEILQHRLKTEARDVIGQNGAPLENNGFFISFSPDNKVLQISQGRLYVDGILCENEADLTYFDQPDFPKPTPPNPFPGPPPTNTACLVYLDVWPRSITALEDPQIREVALNGTETSTRAKTVWQVKVLPVAIPNAGLNPSSQLPEWDALIAGSSGTMNARTQPTLSVDNPCLIPPTAGYQSLENQLYRVEIHQPGPLGTATFKWSRDNGSLQTSVLSINANKVTVHDLGPDEVMGFANGQTIELLTDFHDLHGLPGQLLTIDSVSTATNIITLKTAPNAADIALNLHPRIRRWDGPGQITIPSTTGNWIALENGVQVQFAAGSYATGDYWLIPARTATGEIEWPPFNVPNSNPLAQPPDGIPHDYIRLAILQFNTATQTWQSEDCRSVFPSLTEIPFPDAGIHVTGLSAVDPSGRTSSPLVNDTNVQANAFGGIDVRCDAEINPASISPATCFLSVENPFVVIGAYQVLKLAGTVSRSPNTISWRATADALNLLNNQIVSTIPPGDRGILARLTLKGNFIFALQNPSLYLDGETVGILQGGASNISLQLPGGDRRRGGDFEMWFWLVAGAVTVSGIQMAQSTIVSGATTTATVTLTDKAPAPVAVTLTSSNPGLVNFVPPPPPTQTSINITIPAGSSSSASFTLQAAANLTGQAAITAALGPQSVAASLTVLPLPTLTGGLVLARPSILIGSSISGTVTLTDVAPSDLLVTLSCDLAVATVPANVTVPVNTKTASFTIIGVAAGSTTIIATLGPVSLSAGLTVTIPAQDPCPALLRRIQTLNDKLGEEPGPSPIERKNIIQEIGTLTREAQRLGCNI